VSIFAFFLGTFIGGQASAARFAYFPGLND
jgi:hypothetical protein